MKHKYFILFFFIISLISSCTKTLETPNQTTRGSESPNHLPNMSGETAGDGAYDALGWGYDATKEYANANSLGFQVINLDALRAAYPSRVIEEFPNSQSYIEEYGENAQKYSLMLSSKVDATFNFAAFGKTISAGFVSSITASGKFDAKYIYGSYNLTIHQRRVRINSDVSTLSNYITQDFIDDVNNFYSNPAILVQKYGTHILLDIYTGAKMDVLFQAETQNIDRSLAARIGVKAGVKDIFNLDISNGVDISASSLNFSKKLSYKTRGGNPSFGLTGTLNLDQSNPKIDFTNWQQSSARSNAVLVDIGQYGLLRIYELISDPVKKAAVKAYVDEYLINKQVYLDYLPTPVYRFWNNNKGDHYYTTIYKSYSGYVYEGIEFNAYTYPAPNSSPIYSYYNPNTGDHYYTSTAGNYGGYANEGIAFYAFTSQANNTIPIYQYWNPNISDHFYSRVNGSYGGYSYERIAFYAY